MSGQAKPVVRAKLTLALTLRCGGLSATVTMEELQANPSLLREIFRDLEGMGCDVEAARRFIQRGPFARFL